jgi:hypothetical protein
VCVGVSVCRCVGVGVWVWVGAGNTKGGSITNLRFDWFGLVCFANKNKNCQLSYSHRDKTRVQMPAKIFPHLKVKC